MKYARARNRVLFHSPIVRIGQEAFFFSSVSFVVDLFLVNDHELALEKKKKMKKTKRQTGALKKVPSLKESAKSFRNDPLLLLLLCILLSHPRLWKGIGTTLSETQEAHNDAVTNRATEKRRKCSFSIYDLNA